MRLPFVQKPGQRDGLLTKDALLINCYPETMQDGRTCVRKRPGVTSHAAPASTSTPRGLKYWNSELVSIYGGTLYHNTTAIGAVDFANQISDTAFGASWTETNCTVAASTKTDPAGTTLAYKLTDSAAGSLGQTAHSAITIAAGDDVYFVVWAADNSGEASPGETFKVDISLTGGVAASCSVQFKPDSSYTSTRYNVRSGTVDVKILETGSWYLCIMHMKNVANTSAAVTIYPACGTTLGADDSASVKYNEFYSPMFLKPTTAGTTNFTFDEVGTTDKYLVFADGTKGFALDTSWKLWPMLDAGLDFGAGGIAHMDSYVFALNENGQVCHSGIRNPLTWSILDVINAESYSDGGVAIFRHLNYIGVLGNKTTQFFYDAANSSGSVLSPVDGAIQMVGCANARTLCEMRGVQFFVSDAGAAYLIAEMRPKRVSTPQIERVLIGATLTDAYAFGFEYDGHSLFVLTMPTSNKTLAYDISADEWLQIQDGSGNYWPYVNSATDGTTVYLQGTNGTTYKISGRQDAGANYTMTARTPKTDFGQPGHKRHPFMEVFADKVNGNLDVRYTDDDFSTWSTARNLSLNGRCQSRNWGRFSQRAYEFSYTGSSDLRLYEVEMVLT